jgi:hypothetical protein
MVFQVYDYLDLPSLSLSSRESVRAAQDWARIREMTKRMRDAYPMGPRLILPEPKNGGLKCG